MEDETLKSSIETYKLQLKHVEQAIQAAGATDDLVTLKNDLVELIKLTEDSLLALKKSELLKQLDDQGDGGHSSGVGNQSSEKDFQRSHCTSEMRSTTHGGPSDLDEEYAAFQAMLGGDMMSDPDCDTSTPDNNHMSDTAHSTSDHVSHIYKDLIGTKCRAPYVHDWGEKSYGNALIAGFETQSDTEMPKAQVMFCNPTHRSMLPCKYYLEGSCKFSQEDCRFCHGHVVDLEDLQEFQEPDYSLLKMEAACLARYDDDDVWYKAIVVDMDEGSVTVMFESYEDQSVTLPLEDVIPTENIQDSSDSDDDGMRDNEPISREDSDDDDALPVFLWKPPSHGFGDLGQWEAHTKGIGSKLMTQMGYVPGEGLGKNGEGRIQPVPIQLLPKGKSLDKIMLLKEIAGERNLFDVMEKQEKKMKKQTEKSAKEYQQRERSNMFDFINKKLGGKKGKLSELIHKHEEGHGQGCQGYKDQGHGMIHRTISVQDLNKKSDRNINIQLLKTSQEINSVQKELARLKQSLSRNENRDKAMASQVRQKIQSVEAYLNKLKSSEETMNSHKKKRSDHKKLTVF